ncbi:hypothetical protein DERP_007028 [Dermatophagoides pteronyssinus]|uniref:Uncharacterized protein n=1 Tax=Dermatophagoides pteronyssinus TaxID=6956 RepID=A0ABQ8JTY7_DERPT|nr:hypothetical protein DERP_007028 [Dermatophagoides pteronyssinus]
MFSVFVRPNTSQPNVVFFATILSVIRRSSFNWIKLILSSPINKSTALGSSRNSIPIFRSTFSYGNCHKSANLFDINDTPAPSSNNIRTFLTGLRTRTFVITTEEGQMTTSTYRTFHSAITIPALVIRITAAETHSIIDHNFFTLFGVQCTISCSMIAILEQTFCFRRRYHYLNSSVSKPVVRNVFRTRITVSVIVSHSFSVGRNGNLTAARIRAFKAGITRLLPP